jgi:hypothetical protein
MEAIFIHGMITDSNLCVYSMGSPGNSVKNSIIALVFATENSDGVNYV